MFFYGIDWTYLVLVVPAILLAALAQWNVTATFRKYSTVMSMRRITGYDAARSILDKNGLYQVRIEEVAGNLTDHYDPRANVIRLSQSVYGNSSVASIGVAAHEAGHAVQHATGYAPIQIRNAIIPITNIGSMLSFPLLLLGIFLSVPSLAYIGVAAFGISTVFQLITLPVEFNASHRALEALESNSTLSGTELEASKKVLQAAALTYLAALAVSLANLLRLFLVARRNDRK